MPHLIHRIAIALTLAALSSWASAQALNLRAGGWNMTMSMAMGGGAPRVTPLKTCITKEELDSDQALQKDESCVRKLTVRTPTRLAGTMSCKNEAGQVQGTFEIVAVAPDSVHLTTVSKGKGPQGNIDMRLEMKGRWASASCKGYDD
jgi:hypothetical protein